MKTTNSLLSALFLAFAATASFGETLSFETVKGTLIGSNLEDYIDNDAIYSLCVSANRLFFGGELDSGYVFNGEEYLFPSNDSYDMNDGFVGAANLNSGASLSDLSHVVTGNDTYGEYATVKAVAANGASFVGAGYIYGSSDSPWGMIVTGGNDMSNVKVLGSDGAFADIKFTDVAMNPEGTIFAVASDIDGFSYLIALSASGDYRWDDFVYLGNTSNEKSHLAFNADHSVIYAAVNNELHVLNTSDGTTVCTPVSFSARIDALAIDKSGIINVLTSDAILYRLDKDLNTLNYHTLYADSSALEFTSLSFAEDGRIVIAGNCTGAAFESTDRSSFTGSVAGFVNILAADFSECLFASYLGGGSAKVYDAIFTNDVLTVAGATVETGWLSGGFCTGATAKSDSRTWGFLKTWIGGQMVPDPDGTVQVTLTPSSGKWRINNSDWLESGSSTNLPPGTAYSIAFSPLASYAKPASVSGVAESGVTNHYSLAYTYIPPPLAKRTISGTTVSFDFALPANASYAKIVEKFPSGSTPSPIVTDSSILHWDSRARELYFYNDMATGYTLKCTANGKYKITGTISVYDADNNLIEDSVAVEGDEIFLYPSGLLISIQ